MSERESGYLSEWELEYPREAESEYLSEWELEY